MTKVILERTDGRPTRVVVVHDEGPDRTDEYEIPHVREIAPVFLNARRTRIAITFEGDFEIRDV